jgi:osmotically inducible protein OsmC
MADSTRTGSASWNGDLRTGNGTTSTGGGGLRNLNYSFRSRFEDGTGTNPEELIASAHASCFSMALSMILGNEGHKPQNISTTAKLTMVKAGEGFKITKIHLATEGRVPNIDAAAFQRAAEKAKENCPVSLLLKPGLEALTLEARLVG